MDGLLNAIAVSGGAIGSSPYGFVVLLAIIGIVILIAVLSSSNDNFKFNNADYQYYPPPATVQNKYYKGVASECGGSTYDADCLGKVHLKSFRGDMENMPTSAWDAQTWQCAGLMGDEHAYYKCLNDIYADYRYP